ncbi:lytic transglycosylase domain-containing protein [Paraburkholderia tropica]|uniref:lytic transglycosylase domain-containing protein n=1 Tax=Paraburkholderia tropica TaxID=92647 RepID=UPI003D289338
MWLARASGEAMNQVANDDPGQLAARLAIRAHDWWTNTPENMRTSENLQASGFTQSGFSLAMMRQLGNTPLSELQRASSQYGQDQGRFNVSDRNNDAWYGFLRQLKDAGNTIETDLKNKLVALSGPLEHFVQVIGKDAMKLIDEILTPANLSAMESGINKLTTYLGSKEFGEDVKSFGAAVSELAADAKSLAKIINRIIHPFGDSGGSSTPNLGVAAATGGLDTPAFGGGDAAAANKFMGQATGNIRSSAASAAKNVWGWITDYLSGKDNAAISRSLGLTDVVAAQAMVESSGNPNAVGPATKSGQAKGLLQFTDETARTLGLKNSFDPVQSIDAAVRYDNQLLKRYGGDVRKALAAYNWGPGNLDKDIAKNGANWEQHLPAETRSYLNKIAALLSQKQKINVTVQNNTSARVAVQANAAAAQ